MGTHKGNQSMTTEELRQKDRHLRRDVAAMIGPEHAFEAVKDVLLCMGASAVLHGVECQDAHGAEPKLSAGLPRRAGPQRHG